MGYPQPPVPGYGPPGYPPMGYAAPKSKMRKGPAIAAGVLGILAAVASGVNQLLICVEMTVHDGWQYLPTSSWIVNGIQAAISIGLVVFGGFCLAKSRIMGWLLFGFGLLGLLLIPLGWILEEVSPFEHFEDLFDDAIGITWAVTLVLFLAVAVLALVAALSRERPTWPGAQQYPPQGYAPYGGQY